MADLTNTPRSQLIGVIADALMKAKQTGGPVGDFLLGSAPEVLDNASYGQMPWKGQGHTTQVDPKLLDLAGMLPVGMTAKAARLGKVPEAVQAYHATTAPEFAQFSSEKIGSNLGRKAQDKGFWFSSDPGQARAYASGDPRTRAQVRVLEAQLGLENPAEWDRSLKAAFIEKAQREGHDSVIFRGLEDGTGTIADQYLVFSPDKIKIKRQR